MLTDHKERTKAKSSVRPSARLLLEDPVESHHTEQEAVEDVHSETQSREHGTNVEPVSNPSRSYPVSSATNIPDLRAPSKRSISPPPTPMQAKRPKLDPCSSDNTKLESDVRSSQSKRMELVPMQPDEAMSTMRRAFSSLHARTMLGNASQSQVSDREFAQVLHDYIRTRLQIGESTGLGYQIFGLDVLLCEVFEDLDAGQIWSIAQSALSVPTLLPTPLNDRFKIGLCFWEYSSERSLDKNLAIGDDAAPSSGGKIPTGKTRGRPLRFPISELNNSGFQP